MNRKEEYKMITPHEIYWITRATPTIFSLIGLTVLMGFITLFSLINASVEGDSSIMALVFLILTIIPIIAIVFIPSTRDLVIIKVLPDILNNKDMKNIAPNTAKVIDTQLHKWIIQNLPKNVEPDQIIK